MEEWVKVYEELIGNVDCNAEEYRIWLNDLLDDERIPYKMETVGDKSSIFPGVKTPVFIKFYVYENDVEIVKELIERFQSASFLEEYDELNVSEGDLNYDE